MLYLTKSGKVIEQAVKSHKEWPAILTCALVIGIAVGLYLVLDANPGVIANAQSTLKDVGMAIWNMLCDAVHACAEFVHYVLNTRSK